MLRRLVLNPKSGPGPSGYKLGLLTRSITATLPPPRELPVATNLHRDA
jgi:hypothetical protein